MNSLFIFRCHGNYYEAVLVDIRPNKNYVVSSSGVRCNINDIEIIEQHLCQ